MLVSLERLRQDGGELEATTNCKNDSMNIFKYLAFHASPICPLSRKMPPIVLAHVTQAWLATSEDELAQSSGGYFYHQRPRAPSPIAADPALRRSC
jgi:hypothetical protein